MLIYDVLEKDHEKIKGLLAKLVEAEPGSEEFLEWAIQVKSELIPHARAEEAVFYNSLRGIQDEKLKELIMGHGYGEHVDAENLLLGLLKNEMPPEQAAECARDLQEAVEHHIEEEEDEIWSAARQLLLDEEARMMAPAFQRLKEECVSQDDEENIQELVMNLLPEKFGDNPHHL